MSELQTLLDEFVINPSGETCRKITDCIVKLPRYRLREKDLDRIQKSLSQMQPVNDAEKENIRLVYETVSDYRERNESSIGSITRGLNRIANEFEGIYSREDFESQLDKIASNESDRSEQVNILYQMIDHYNSDFLSSRTIKASIAQLQRLNLRLEPDHRIPAEKLKETKYRVESIGSRTKKEIEAYNDFYYTLIDKADIPEADEMKQILLKYILKECRNYPSPSRRMLQIVNYMTEKTDLFRKDSWKEDSLRLRILKQFIKYGDCLMYRDALSGKRVYIVTGKEELLSYAQKKYRDIGEDIDQGKITNQMILEKIDEHVFDVIEVERITEIILSAVIRMREAEDKWENLENHIVCPCAFRREAVDYYLDRLKKKFPNGKCSLYSISHYIRHGIYKDNIKPNNTWELLRAANDLAEGRFGEDMKRYLYLFAMVFGMTYQNRDVPDYEITDVDINLFQKFYVDEPQRYLIVDEAADGRLDMPPSGEGINRRNFEEIIYLYFIRKPFDTKEDLISKVINSGAMIRKLKNPEEGDEFSEQENSPGLGKVQGSIDMYREKEEQALSETADEDFEKFVRENYNCCVAKKKLYEIESQQDSAYREYQFCIVVMYGLLAEGGVDRQDLSELRGSSDLLNERFQEIVSKDKKVSRLDKKAKNLGIGQALGWYDPNQGQEWDPDAMAYVSVKKTRGRKKESEDELKNFEGDIEKTQLDYARGIISQSERMINSCFPLITSPEKMSRNALLGAYYYSYNLLNFKGVSSLEEPSETPLGFMGAYEDFGKGRRDDGYNGGILKGADFVLKSAGYQPLSRYNLLDLLVIFSVYEKYAALKIC